VVTTTEFSSALLLVPVVGIVMLMAKREQLRILFTSVLRRTIATLAQTKGER
jgi:hypothetical protein